MTTPGFNRVLNLAVASCMSAPIAYAQNLVPNPGFETMLQCPNAYSQLNRTAAWYSPTLDGTPDYYHACASSGYGVPINYAGDQAAHGGNAYVAIYLWFSSLANMREYVEVELQSPLEAGVCYEFSMYVSLSDESRYTTHAIGVYLSGSSVQDIPGHPPLVQFQPNVLNADNATLSNSAWQQVAGTITAAGGERFIVIGNFNDDATTPLTSTGVGAWLASYCYLDDVSLTPCGPLGVVHAQELVAMSWPNPFSENIHLGSGTTPGTRLRVYDCQGALVHQGLAIPDAIIDAATWDDGLYIFEFIAPEGSRQRNRVLKLTP